MTQGLCVCKERGKQKRMKEEKEKKAMDEVAYCSERMRVACSNADTSGSGISTVSSVRIALPSDDSIQCRSRPLAASGLIPPLISLPFVAAVRADSRDCYSFRLSRRL